MRRFRVTVNGEVFEVCIEECGEDGRTMRERAPGPAPSLPAGAAGPAAMIPSPGGLHPPAAVPPVTPFANGTVVAPMSGVIREIRVVTGQQVKKGDVLFVLEAMKMENEILSPGDGVVSRILVSPAAAVQTGQGLAVLG